MFFYATSSQNYEHRMLQIAAYLKKQMFAWGSPQSNSFRAILSIAHLAQEGCSSALDFPKSAPRK